MLITKNTVRFGGFTRELIEILDVLERVSRIVPHDVVITAGSDGKHMPNSKHYTYQALDVRSKNLQDKDTFVQLLKTLLGDKYTILFEDAGTPNEHIHIQVKK
jgi:hypothetical protein